MPPAKFPPDVAKANQLKVKLTRYQPIRQERSGKRDQRSTHLDKLLI
jgi:hypothetical protein